MTLPEFLYDETSITQSLTQGQESYIYKHPDVYMYVVDIDLREYRSYCNPQRLLEWEPATWAELTSFSFSNCEGSYLTLVSLGILEKYKSQNLRCC